MTMHTLFADWSIDSRLLDRGFLVPIVVGAVAGLGVVATIHFFNRRRAAAAATTTASELAEHVASQGEERDPFVQGSLGEQREAYRRTGNPIEVMIVDKAEESRQVKAHVVNRSVSGICLALPIPFKEDTEVNIRPKSAANAAPWIEMVVKNCRKTDEGFEIGCQFVKSPPWPVLMMLG